MQRFYCAIEVTLPNGSTESKGSKPQSHAIEAARWLREHENYPVGTVIQITRMRDKQIVRHWTRRVGYWKALRTKKELR